MTFSLQQKQIKILKTTFFFFIKNLFIMQKSSITHFEQQLYEKISYLKDIMLTFYTQLLYFCGTATAAYNALWQL